MAPHLSYLQDKEDLCHLWNLWDKKTSSVRKESLGKRKKPQKSFEI